LAGPSYPDGIPIFPEPELATLVRRFEADDVVFSYSDVSHRHVMHLASIALAHSASFRLLGPRDTMLAAPVPTVAVVASRTGAGKSTVTRSLVSALKAAGRLAVVVRHPMPYGRLDRGFERYETADDLLANPLTIEELEEYQPHVDAGNVVFAGVDYSAVLERASAEARVLVWDGGNNDMAFFAPTVTVTVLDPTRPGQEDDYFPGEVNVRAADLLVIGKANAATAEQVEAAAAAARKLNAAAPIVPMAFAPALDRPELVRDRAVLVVEDGPSVTHGGMREGVGAAAARACGGRPVDPRPYAVGSIAQAYERYPQLGCVLPALGYDDEQREALRATIERAPCDTVLLGTPADLQRLLGITKPVARAAVEARDVGSPPLGEQVVERIARK
jgi:predicted GTPase